MPTEKVINLAERRHEKNPFRKRELYIVGGEHCLSRLDPKQAKDFVNLEMGLIEMIALRKRCTGFFEDGMSKEDAGFFNRLIANLEASDGPGQERMLEHLWEGEEKADGYGAALSIEMMAGIRKAGIRISYLPMEEPFDALGILEGKIPFEEFDILLGVMENAINDLGEEEGREMLRSIIHGNQQYWELLMRERDPTIFGNVSKYAEERNIMLIGRDHLLDDFRKKKHNFEVRRVDLVEGAPGVIQMRGSMPPSLKPIFDSLGRQNAGLEVQVTFSDT